MITEKNFYTEENFIESPIYDNWFKKHYPQHSLVICSPYIKKDALDKIIDLYELDRRDKFDFRVLIRGNEAEFTSQKSSDIYALDSLKSLKCIENDRVRRVKNLHMKAYLVDGTYLLITSGNLTNSGLFVISGKENFEGGISTNATWVIDKFLLYFKRIWEQGETLDDFYDELMTSYINYIHSEYSDRNTLARVAGQKYEFMAKTNFDSVDKESLNHRITQENDVLLSKFGNNHVDVIMRSAIDTLVDTEYEGVDDRQTFTLGDIPPVGTLELLPQVLEIAKKYPDGISYLELGELLRKVFAEDSSHNTVANRKFGEEKSKFAAFFNLVNIEHSEQGMIVKINKLGESYLAMNAEGRNKVIKDAFFDKPIVVSIMRKHIEDPYFDLLSFLKEHCEGTTKTLERKVGPLKALFSYISSVCTEKELQNMLNIT